MPQFEPRGREGWPAVQFRATTTNVTLSAAGWPPSNAAELQAANSEMENCWNGGTTCMSRDDVDKRIVTPFSASVSKTLAVKQHERDRRSSVGAAAVARATGTNLYNNSSPLSNTARSGAHQAVQAALHSSK